MARAHALADKQSLYERDFCLWLEQQAALLREGRLNELDIANLLEEIESVGRKDRKAIKSNLTIVLSHLLKYQFQPDLRSRSWPASIIEHRQRLRDDLDESPSLAGHAKTVFERAYADARARVIAETGLAAEQLPSACPYSLKQALNPDFLPE